MSLALFFTACYRCFIVLFMSLKSQGVLRTEQLDRQRRLNLKGGSNDARGTIDIRGE